MKNIEKLLEQQRQIAAQIAAARAAHARLEKLGGTLARHPAIFQKFSNDEILQVLLAAVAAADNTQAEPVEKPGRGKESLNGNTQAVAGGGNADDYA